MPKIKLQKTGQEFHCRKQDTILRAALRSGIGFPYECNSGSCGTCMFEIIAGSLEEQWPDSPGLSRRAREKNRRLACQCSPTSDCVIHVRARPQYVPAIRPSVHSATFVGSDAITRDMAEFHFRTDESSTGFLPGQYALMYLPNIHGPRAYSMSNLPNNEGHWSFIVKKAELGAGTRILFDHLSIGDKVQLDAPYGTAYLQHHSPRDIVCIGGGSGLSPLRSIVSAAVRDPVLSRRDIIFFYGARKYDDLCVPQVFKDDPHVSRNVRFITSVSDEDNLQTSDKATNHGLIHETVAQFFRDGGRDPAHYDYYFCGPPAMTEAIQRLIALDFRVPFSQLHYDKFF